MKVKKVAIAVGCALLLGIGFGIFFFKDASQDIKEALGTEAMVYAFQVGVYTNKENAIVEAKKYESGKVILDEELYRVYIAMVKSEEARDKLKQYYDEQNIEYYVKKINVKGDFLNMLNKYEDLLLASNQEVYTYINKEILANYSDVVI